MRGAGRARFRRVALEFALDAGWHELSFALYDSEEKDFSGFILAFEVVFMRIGNRPHKDNLDKDYFGDTK